MYKSLLALASLVAMLGGAQAANLVSNGTFVPDGSGNPTGWAVLFDSNTDVGTVFSISNGPDINSGLDCPAASCLVAGPVDGFAHVSQAITTAAPGNYTISFDLGSIATTAGSNSSFSASFGGQVILASNDVVLQPWQHFSLVAAETGGSTPLSFSFLAPGGYYGITNVSVLAGAVPEPSAYALMLAGLGALGFLARRRTKA